MVRREERNGGLAWHVKDDLASFAFIAADYLHDVPEPEQGINLINKFEVYFLGDEVRYTPKIKSGLYAFYISGDMAWVGAKLPTIFWTKGNNYSRKHLQASKNIPLYGSESIDSPPPDDSEKYRYKQKNDVVWRKVDKSLFGVRFKAWIEIQKRKE